MKDARISIEKLHNKLQENRWTYKKFEIEGDKKHLLYNEYAYFYDYARDALYNSDATFDTDAISHFYEQDEIEGEAFTLKIRKRKKPYRLNIKSVTLRIFNTGIGVLAIELENRTYTQLADILNINDFGRRIYPQFIGENDLEASKNVALADSITIGEYQENFKEPNIFNTYVGEHIMALLGKNIFTQYKRESNKYYLQPSLDDRMFVVSWYGSDEESNRLKEKDYLQDDDWCRYLFIDNGDITIENSAMKQRLLESATYERWSDIGTLYGISRYSFMTLTSREWFPLNIIQPHVGTMYFQMMTLLLATRTSILRFSDEIASLASTNKNIEIKKLTKLYQRYLTFYNRLYFKEVTHQEQGIELYEIARKQMKIDEHMEKLDNKFNKLFEFAKIQSDSESSDKMDKLTYLGAIFLPPSLMVAILSIGIFDYNNTDNIAGWVFGSIMLTVIFGIFSIFKSFQKKSMAILYGVLFTMIVLIAYGNIDAGHQEKPVDVKIVK